MTDRSSFTGFPALPDCALLRERQLIGAKGVPGVLPFSSPTLWRRVKSGDFPPPIRLEGRMTCWRWGDVKTWLEAQGQPEKAA